MLFLPDEQEQIEIPIKAIIAVEALLAVFLISSTALVSVGLGVAGSYYAISAILSAFNPARPRAYLAALAPRESQASGD